jgi:hypothetical protein
MGGQVTSWGQIGRQAVVATVDLIAAAHGIPPLTGVTTAAGSELGRRVADEARARMALFAHAAETAAGASLDEVAKRAAERPDGASRLYAALDLLTTHHGNERATMLGAVIGESMSDGVLNEIDALDALLAIALNLDPVQARLLRALEVLDDQVQPGHGGLTLDQLRVAVPGMGEVLRGVLAACVAAGTVQPQTWSEGLDFGGPSEDNEWRVAPLGRQVLEYLRAYTPSSPGRT